MKIAIIFVLHKTTKSELNSIKKQFRQIFPTCIFFTIDNNRRNRGYAKAVNRGLKLFLQSKRDIAIVANTDIRLPKISAHGFTRVLSHFDIGGLAIKQNGRTYFGGTLDPWYLSGSLGTRKGNLRFKSTDFISGSLMMIKRKVVERIGLFDDSYFMYYEDVDYCQRAKRSGFKVGIDTNLTYIHFEKSSLHPLKQKFLSTSHKHYFENYANWLQKSRIYLKNLYEHFS